MIAPVFGKGEEMKIVMGPLTRARPEWGLEKGGLATLVADGPEGRPEVLAAQILFGVAMQGTRVLMLLPVTREVDETWKAMVSLMADGDTKSAAQAMRSLPISMHTCGTGWEKIGRADLIYAPGLNAQEMRRLSSRTDASILAVGSEFGRQSSNRPVEVIRVGGSAILIDSKGVEIPVVYDPSGPIYRPA
ncbi:hypothetical protein ACFW2V_12380 [Streptomyces sp. NPDC058947]|uniref:hypothetical protein n=1 Tax=Streptomyces sp. NPDC058947 TaxID=3346675 RepID=UPI0036BBC408